MTYDEIVEQLEITKSKIKEIARNEYGGELLWSSIFVTLMANKIGGLMKSGIQTRWKSRTGYTRSER